MPAQTPESLELVRALMREYQVCLGVDLCFKDFEADLASLPRGYAKPSGGLLLALGDGALAQCGKCRPLLHIDQLNACEMKRVYLRPVFRGLGVGRLLVVLLIDHARLGGHATMLLDSLSDMKVARSLYRQVGFNKIPPYCLNPLPGARHLKTVL